MSIEKDIRDEIRLALSEIGITVWTNPVGVLDRADGGRQSVGLFKGSSDLIGIKPFVIREEHLGLIMGQFVAIEVKTLTGRATPEQLNFISVIRQHGGAAGIARNRAEALAIVAPQQNFEP